MPFIILILFLIALYNYPCTAIAAAGIYILGRGVLGGKK
jgi:hypothetical protein